MPAIFPAPLWFVLWVLFRHGHVAPEPRRRAFVRQLLSFADLDGYPRRPALKAAFAPGGTRRARWREAVALARYGVLERADFRYAAAPTLH